MNVARLGCCYGFIRSPNEKRIAVYRHTGRERATPLSTGVGRPRYRLTENGFLPKSHIFLWKVAKILHFLATFLIHPCTFVSRLDLMPWTADQLVQPI
jgi:hypothetical protein